MIVSAGGAPAADCDAAGDHPSSDTGEPLRHAIACAIIALLGPTLAAIEAASSAAAKGDEDHEGC